MAELRALLIDEEHGWSAQILEYDVACQAKTFRGIIQELQRTITLTGYLATELGLAPPLARTSPAPQLFHDLWDKSIPIRIPESWAEQPALRVGEPQPA